MIKYEKYVLLKDFETNTYLVWDDESREAMLIDPGAAGEQVAQYLRANRLELKYIINTHGHGDHIEGNRFFKERFDSAKLCVHKDDELMLYKADLNLSLFYEKTTISPPADVILEDGMTLFLGKEEIKVIHTPGHTRGGICLLLDKYLFSGDTLFEENVGRTDLPGGSFADLAASIRDKLFVLSENLIVLPGHGDQTNIGEEKRFNPYVGEE